MIDARPAPRAAIVPDQQASAPGAQSNARKDPAAAAALHAELSEDLEKALDRVRVEYRDVDDAGVLPALATALVFATCEPGRLAGGHPTVRARSETLLFRGRRSRVLARSWLIAPPGSADPGRRRDDCIPLESDRRDLPGADERNGDIWITPIAAGRRRAHDCFRGAGPSDTPPSPLAQCHGCDSRADPPWP